MSTLLPGWMLAGFSAYVLRTVVRARHALWWSIANNTSILLTTAGCPAVDEQHHSKDRQENIPALQWSQCQNALLLSSAQHDHAGFAEDAVSQQGLMHTLKTVRVKGRGRDRTLNAVRATSGMLPACSKLRDSGIRASCASGTAM
jgi:hypothetical protein